MPSRQRELGGDDCRSSAISFLEDFEQIVTSAGVEGFEAEVVENEQIGAAERFDEARVASAASRERGEILTALWRPGTSQRRARPQDEGCKPGQNSART